MDLRQLLYFEAVYRLSSFSRAAEELSLTHSALTKSIKTLEHSWDKQLFHRTTRMVTPTPAGHRLYPMAVRLLAYAEDTKRQTIHGNPVLSIITHPAILETVMAQALAEFRKHHPETKVLVKTMEPYMAAEELLSRRAHLMLYHSSTIRGLPQIERLRVRTLTEEPNVISFRRGHPLEGHQPTNEELLTYDWAVVAYYARHRTDIPAEAQNMLNEANFPRYDLDSMAACVDLCVRSDVVTAMPLSYAQRFVDLGIMSTAPQNFPITLKVSGATLIDTAPDLFIEEFMDGFITSHERVTGAATPETEVV